MKHRQTLYLLAADLDFRLLRGRGAVLEEIAHRQAEEFSDVTDRFPVEAGRGHASGVSFGVNERGESETEARRRFARHAASALEAEWAGDRYDRIVLVAGPKMLGALRDLLPEPLAGEVAAELVKDLVKVPVHDLPEHFRDLPAA